VITKNESSTVLSGTAPQVMLVICGLVIFIKCSLYPFYFLESMNLNIKFDVPHCLQYSVFFLITGTKWSGVAKTHPLLGYRIAVNSSKNVIVQPIDMMLVRWCFLFSFYPVDIVSICQSSSSLHIGCCCVLLQLDRILQFLLRLFVLLVAMC
jgi:hypothetical protein